MIKKNVSLFLIILFGIFFCFKKMDVTSSIERGNYGVIDWDNFGYYMYLPAIFIHKDIKLQDPSWAIAAQKEYSLSSNFYQAHHIHNGNRVIQYTSGMAIIYSPAFFTGHILAKISHYKADGFSKPYQLALLLQSFLMVFLGLFFLRKLSLQFFSEKLTIWLLIIMCFGTNYFQIIPANISSPHVYLFAFYAAIIYFTVKWHNNPKVLYVAIVGVLLAIMILSRPNELLFLMVPLFWVGGKFNSLKEKLNYLFQNKKHLLAIVIPLLVFGIIQPIYWRYVTGEWIHDSYRNEGFRLLDPYLFNYLFSYKKGWLLYTPVMIFALLGFISFVRSKPKQGILLLLFSVLNIWVLSSWDCWWYADSFSQRSIVQSYPVFFLSLGFLINQIQLKSAKLNIALSVVILILIGFNLFQIFQFNNWVLHSQRMTKEYYWEIFGKTSNEGVNRNLLDVDRNLNHLPENRIAIQEVIYNETFEKEGVFNYRGFEFEKEGVLLLDETIKSLPPIKFAVSELFDTSYAYLVCKVVLKSNYESWNNNFGIEFTATDNYNGKRYGYKYKNLTNLKSYKKGKWNTLELVVIPPILRGEEDSIRFDFLHFGNQPIEVDRVIVELFDPSATAKKDKLEYPNDLTSGKKWNWSLSKPADAGEFFELIDSTNEYSSIFQIPIKEVGTRRHLTFESNVNLQHNYSSTNAIVSVDHEGKNLYYKSVPLVLNKLGWEQFKIEVDLPTDLAFDAIVKTYLWNKSKEFTLVKDLKITIE